MEGKEGKRDGGRLTDESDHVCMRGERGWQPAVCMYVRMYVLYIWARSGGVKDKQASRQAGRQRYVGRAGKV